MYRDELEAMRLENESLREEIRRSKEEDEVEPEEVSWRHRFTLTDAAKTKIRKVAKYVTLILGLLTTIVMAGASFKDCSDDNKIALEMCNKRHPGKRGVYTTLGSNRSCVITDHRLCYYYRTCTEKDITCTTGNWTKVKEKIFDFEIEDYKSKRIKK